MRPIQHDSFESAAWSGAGNVRRRLLDSEKSHADVWRVAGGVSSALFRVEPWVLASGSLQPEEPVEIFESSGFNEVDDEVAEFVLVQSDQRTGLRTVILPGRGHFARAPSLESLLEAHRLGRTK